LTLAWPVEYGGQAANPTAQLVYNEELAYAGAPVGFGFGPNLVGPTLMVWGTEEQKRRHLPAIAKSEVFWCQGFSEPGAGSDLASLQTRATRDGDDYVINGQKIWTSEGHRGEWMILLARTDTEAPKHRGISYFLVDMRTPGISVQPLVNLMGGHAFNQVFFDNVRVPCANLVGEENRGWYVAATTLDFERSGINRVTWTRRQLDDLKAFLSETAPVDLRSGIKLADLTIELEIARLLCYRVAYLQTLGVVPNYESSMAKLYGSEAIYRFATAAVGLLGLAGQLQPGSKWAALNARIERTYLASVSYSIAGGTSEIQRGVIATRGLNLPR
jgi:alkylation response protein AidB-like acyl-CoA dehydrogenase